MVVVSVNRVAPVCVIEAADYIGNAFWAINRKR
jgi:hypothetical protein